MVGIGGELLTGRRTLLDPMNGVIGLRRGCGGAEECGTGADDHCNHPLAFHSCPFRTASRIFAGRPRNAGRARNSWRSLRKMGWAAFCIVSHAAGDTATVGKDGTPTMRQSCTEGQFPPRVDLYRQAIARRGSRI